jgi:hypothetical protein
MPRATVVEWCRNLLHIMYVGPRLVKNSGTRIFRTTRLAHPGFTRQDACESIARVLWETSQFLLFWKILDGEWLHLNDWDQHQIKEQVNMCLVALGQVQAWGVGPAKTLWSFLPFKWKSCPCEKKDLMHKSLPTSPSLREGGFAAAHADTAPKLPPGGGRPQAAVSHSAAAPKDLCQVRVAWLEVCNGFILLMKCWRNMDWSDRL